MPRSGGRVAVLLLLPGALPGPPAAGTPRSVKRLQGVGDPGPATRARNPAAADASTSNQTSRPALLDCRQSTAPAHPLAHVPHHARHVAPLPSTPDCETLDVHRPTWSPADSA